MSKADLPFSALDLSRVWRPPNKPKWASDTPIHGWDSETCGNEPVVISYAWDGERGQTLHNDTERVDSESIFKLLTHKNARSSLNVWYNLDFDANVILAHLPRNVVYHIGVFGQDEWNGYEITYLKKKLLCIRDSNKHKILHFDVAQIFFQTGGSLDGALQSWLNRRKSHDELDRTRFQDREYLRENWDAILDYAGKDAEDVRDVWRSFTKVAEPLEIPCARPYSTGYLAEQCYNNEYRKPGNSKPSFTSPSMQQLAWDAYRGGRFEVVERGEVGEVVTVDINSAYPNVLRTLPDPGSLQWRRHVRPDYETLARADYGFVRATVATDPTRPLQPFATKQRGRLVFPVLNGFEVTATLPEFRFAVESGIVTHYRVDEAWTGKRTSRTVYPFDWINRIYAKRQEYKQAGNEKASTVLKIIINSLYGKLAQLTEVTERTDPDGEWKKHFIWQPTNGFPPHLREWMQAEEIELHKIVKAGAYFNPFLASYVTGLTRLQLLETAVEYKLENAVKILATDGIAIDADAFDACGLPLDATELGAWDMETRGRMFLVGSGVYEIEQADGTTKSRTRGFESGFGVYGMDLGDLTLRQAAKESVFDPDRGESVIPLSNERPLKISQALWQNYSLSEVGVFRDFPRGLSAGMDRKRRWPRGDSVSWDELLTGSERSEPLEIVDGDLR